MGTEFNMLGTADVARILKLSESRVRQFVMQGRLNPAGRFGINLLFERKEVVAFAKTRRPTGRPKKNI